MAGRQKQKIDVARFILNCLPSPGRERDWGITAASGAGMLGAPAVTPPSRNLRAPWWPVNSQGVTGSCVGWGTADGVLRWHLAKGFAYALDKYASAAFTEAYGVAL